MHQLLIAQLKETVPLDDRDIPLIEKAFVAKKLKRRDMLLQAGDTSNHMRFIAEGCLRVYYLDTEAREHILQFGIEGWWVNDLYSYLIRHQRQCRETLPRLPAAISRPGTAPPAIHDCLLFGYHAGAPQRHSKKNGRSKDPVGWLVGLASQTAEARTGDGKRMLGC